jgi:hypothetical protein
VLAAAGEHRPIQMVDGLIGTIGAIASVAGIVEALLAIQPWLVPLLFLAGLPLLASVMKAGQAMFGFHMRMTSVARARNYLYRLLTDKDPAKEVRAFGLAEYLTGRHAVLYEQHMTELRARTSLFNAAAVGLLDRVRDHLTSDPPASKVTSAFWAACHGGQRATAELLLQHGADLDCVAPWDRLTPLDAARRSNADPLATWLVEHGALPSGNHKST